MIPADEWSHVERGLIQRVTTLNHFLEDLYAGERAALHDGIVPRWLVQSSAGFVREAHGIPVPRGARCLVAGIDIVRDGDGVYRVLEDNVRTPSGISYVLENRAAMTRVLPVAFAQLRVRPVNLCMRTTRGLVRVDVIYKRIDDDFLDPVVFRSGSTLGVPGLLAAARAGNVTISNAVGNGVADDKALYPYLPALIRFYLGEEPILPNVETYLLWEPEQRAASLSRLHELVVKPVGVYQGAGEHALEVAVQMRRESGAQQQ